MTTHRSSDWQRKQPDLNNQYDARHSRFSQFMTLSLLAATA
jgi:hypothetical protein